MGKIVFLLGPRKKEIQVTSVRNTITAFVHFCRSSEWRFVPEHIRKQLEVSFAEDGEFWYARIVGVVATARIERRIFKIKNSVSRKLEKISQGSCFGT